MSRKYLQSLCLAGFLAFPASLALANHIDSASVALTCTQYRINVTAGELASNDSYSIQYTFTLSSTTGRPPLTITSTMPVAAESPMFTDGVTIPLSLIDNYSIESSSGSASLVVSSGQTANTVQMTFSPVALNCSPPPA
jgi:hypothetical protein